MDLHSKGFKVIICLNHFTLPIWIHNPIEARKNRLKRGRLGWLDKHTIVEFTKYCGYIAYRFGDIVDYWATFNEPMIVAEAGYLKYEGFPPHYNDMGFPPSLVRSAFVRAVFNIINAHARAYDAIKYFDKEYAGDSDSPCSVGLIHNVEPIYPLRPDNDNDINASNFIDHMHNHLFIEAVRNGWLDENLDRKKSGSEIKHFLGNRLDWIGINYYNRFVIKGKLGFIARKLAKIPAFFELVDGYGYLGGMRRNLIQKLFGWEPKKIVTYVSRDGYPVSEFGWELYPEGIAICIDLMKKYDLPLFITENGVADSMDILRPWFIASHLKVLSQKLGEKGLDLRGYFHWALTDNYEWARGFKMRFGLYHVNLRTKERTPRKSVSIYKEIIINRKVTREVESKVKPQIKDKD
jgi:beta-galactosidase